MKISRGCIAVLITILSVTALLSGCENNDIQDWRVQVRGLREQAERQIAQTPYRDDQHQAFKSYFTNLSTMALSLEQDAGKRQRFNEAVHRFDVGALCQEIFMAEARWIQLMTGCAKNRFFLCAEEVRAYPTLHQALRSALSADLARRFEQAVQCREPRGLRVAR